MTDKDEGALLDQLNTHRRSVALLALGKVLTFQSISQWHRVVSRVLSVSVSELHYYCACSLIRNALSDLGNHTISNDAKDLSSDPINFDLLLGEIFGTGVKKMSYSHLCAFIDCILDRSFTPEKHDGLVFVNLQSWSNSIILSSRDRRSLVDAWLRVLLAVDVEEEYRQDTIGVKSSTVAVRARQKTFAVTKDEFLSLVTMLKSST